jgi:hypothetical protein
MDQWDCAVLTSFVQGFSPPPLDDTTGTKNRNAATRRISIERSKVE